MRILICGDRHWNDYNSILDIIKRLKAKYINVTIIEGECEGADLMARQAAGECSLRVDPYPAEWYNLEAKPCKIKYDKNGKPYNALAGPNRNQRMIDEGKPDMCIAFHSDIEHSRGTKDIVNKTAKYGIRTYIIKK